MACSRPGVSQAFVARRISAAVTSSEATNTPRRASSACSGSRSCAFKACTAFAASCEKAVRIRSVFHCTIWRMPSASISVTSAIVSPTLNRRGTQASRGRPKSVSMMGAAISMPSRSPTHQVARLAGSSLVSTAPEVHSARLPMIGFTKPDTIAISMNAAMSRGSERISGRCR